LEQELLKWVDEMIVRYKRLAGSLCGQDQEEAKGRVYRDELKQEAQREVGAGF